MPSSIESARPPTGGRDPLERRTARRLPRSAPQTAAPVTSGHLSIGDELLRLDQLDPEALRIRWQAQMGNKPAAHLPRSVMVRVLAYRLQADAFGDLDPELVRQLARIADGRAGVRRGSDPSEANGQSLSLSAIGIADERTGRLQPGCVLVREHAGVMHHVMVLAEGFAWNGQTYSSLSKVALAITGTSWNGPRFFGLDRKPSNQSPDPRANQKAKVGVGRKTS
jgi:hypothetical protein